MKKLQSLGTLLSRSEQKKIVGGYNTHLICKKNSGEECIITGLPNCNPDNLNWMAMCMSGSCSEYTDSVTCVDY